MQLLKLGIANFVMLGQIEAALLMDRVGTDTHYASE